MTEQASLRALVDARTDDVRGVVIGGDYCAWQAVYDGRTQSGKYYADTADEAEQTGRACIDALKAECCGHPCYLYPDDALWSLRLWP